jgi:hypothetical protein
MEDMKAVFRLNEEKLEFNKKVLDDRHVANSAHCKVLKERERKLNNLKTLERQNYKN